jgi:pimeloyl-ACP methyl ester carboxylesterase
LSYDRRGRGESGDTLPYDAFLCENYQRGLPLRPGEWDSVVIPTLVMTGTERQRLAFLGHAAKAVAANLPNAELVTRKGLDHAKKLTPKAISATLAEFFSD